MTGQPQDRRPSARDMMNNALRMQSANMAQKATLDLIGGKLIMVVGVLQRAHRSDRNSNDVNRESMEEISSITRLTRSQVAERLSSRMFEYPDVEIQAVINRASEEIAALLMPKADGE